MSKWKRPKVGETIEWFADNTGGGAVVVEVLERESNDVMPDIRAQAEGWCKPSTFMAWEYNLKRDDPEACFIEDTRRHVAAVRRNLRWVCHKLEERCKTHDVSKFHEPELPIFVRETAALKDLEYGSQAYMDAIKRLGPALQHHYEANDHHPEHFENGVGGMNLFQLVEMYCDWLAATERMKDGNIEKSIAINRERFGLSDQLAQIFLNTAHDWRKAGKQ